MHKVHQKHSEKFNKCFDISEDTLHLFCFIGVRRQHQFPFPPPSSKPSYRALQNTCLSSPLVFAMADPDTAWFSISKWKSGVKYENSIIELKDEIEGKKTSLLAQMCNRILVMLPIMWLNIS